MPLFGGYGVLLWGYGVLVGGYGVLFGGYGALFGGYGLFEGGRLGVGNFGVVRLGYEIGSKRRLNILSI